MLRKLCLVVAVASVLMVQCRNQQKANSTLPADTLVAIIYDLHMADGIYSLPFARTNLKIGNDTLVMYGYVFEKHGITKAIFDSALAQYAKNTDQLEKIYEKVIAKLEANEALLDSSARKPE